MDQLYFFLSELGAWKKFRDNATMSIYMYIYNILLCYRLIFPHKPVSGNLEDVHCAQRRHCHQKRPRITVKKKKCSGNSEILHEIVRDTTRISSCFSDFRVASR